MVAYKQNMDLNYYMTTSQEITGIIWAQYFTVGPSGIVDCGGEQAKEVSESEARFIASYTGQLKDIMWIDFEYNPFNGISEEEIWTRTGESYIATSRRTHDEVVFKPVSDVIEKGHITKYAASWLGKIANGDNVIDNRPDRYDELLELAKI